MHQRSKAYTYGWFRAGLVALALVAAITGFWAFLLPESFFTTFPLPGHSWVVLLPPYNEHLVRDVGEFNLSFALLFTWAAIVFERRLVQAILVAWLVYAVPHFVYHLLHLEHFAPVDRFAQTIGLGSIVLLPLVLLVALRRFNIQMQ